MAIEELSGITVTCFKKNEDGSFTNVGSSITDSAGLFSIGDLDDGEYTLKYEDTERNNYYRTVYLGGVFTLDEAVTFTVVGGGNPYQKDYQMPLASYVNGFVTGVVN